MNICLKTNSRKVDEIIFDENMKFLIVECSCLTFFVVTLINACKNFPKNTHTHTQVTILGSAENQHPPSTYLWWLQHKLYYFLERLNFFLKNKNFLNNNFS
jgi:hypothetical protein